MTTARRAIGSWLHLIFFSSKKATVCGLLFAAVVGVLIVAIFRQAITTHPAEVRREADSPTLSSVDSSAEVLVLNSYHSGYSWSDNEMEGIFEVFRQGPRRILPIVEYLDCKRHPAMEHFERQKDLFLQKYARKHFPVVLVTDNPALAFALKYRSQLFPGSAIVFCGINGFNRQMIAGQQNVTGVAELLDADGTLDIALRLHPKTREVVVVHDYTITGLSTRKETEAQLEPFSPRVKIRYLENLPVPELLQTLADLPPDSIVLALSYSIDREGRVINHETIARLLSTSAKVPVFGLHEERLGHGIVGGKLLGGRLHAARAATMTRRIVEGEPASAIPVDLRSPTRAMFDYRQLVRFGIGTSALPGGSIVINRPVSFLSEHRGLTISTGLLIIVLLGGIAFLWINIYERKSAEDALAASEQRFRTLFECAGDAQFIEDMEGRIIDVNEEGWRRMEYSRDELRGRTLADITDPAHKEALSANRERLRVNRSSLCESVHLTRTGTPVPVELNSRVIDYAGGKAVLSIARDISERKKAESERQRLQTQLLHSQKMDSIGRLAGGVAHDFNNVLTSILGYCEILMDEVDRNSPMFRQIDIIRNSAQRGALLTGQLLAFSRKQILDIRPVNLVTLAEQMSKMIARIIGEDIIFDLITTPVRNILADRSQLDQVLMNLVINARDAMPEGGKLSIEIREASLDSTISAAQKDVQPGDYVMLAVSDSGRGIAAEIRERIFEPFFTTKEAGKGTGLGLATVYGIVKQHHGHIAVQSEPGEGTVFRAYFPVTEVSASAPAAVSAAVPSRGDETILVVDDDATIVTMIAQTLGRLGYAVLSASSPQEALRTAQEHSGPIRLLLTDVIMPAMNGRALADAIASLHPETRVLFMSGYDDDIITHRGAGDRQMDFLQKPISQERLSSKIREILDRR